MAALDGLTILLIEDEPLIALDVEQLCLEHGAAAVRIVGKAEALATAGEAFDAAIVDVSLDGTPTLAFARGLMENRIPFIFATGRTGTDDAFAPFPGVPVVGKPYFGSALMDSLAEAIRRARSDHGGGA